MQSDNTEQNIPVTVSLGTAGIAGILSHTKPSYAGNFKRFIFFPCTLTYLILHQVSKCQLAASEQASKFLKIFLDIRRCYYLEILAGFLNITFFVNSCDECELFM